MLVLDDVRYDRATKRLTSVARSTAEARLLPDDRRAYLDTQDGIHEAAVTLRPPDDAILRFRPDLRGFTLPLGLTPELLGRPVTRRLSAHINPVVDLTGPDITRLVRR